MKKKPTLSGCKLIICANSSWNLLNFRSELISALQECGHEVVTLAPIDAYAEAVMKKSSKHIAIKIDSIGKNPLTDLVLVFRFWRVFFREKPDFYLGYTIKPNIYGSLAAHLQGIKVINNVAGLGVVFGKTNFLTYLVKLMYRIAFRSSVKVFFQNADDMREFVNAGLVNPTIAERLPGSGVNLKKFKYQAVENSNKNCSRFRFILVARLLWDKGVGEYVQAARKLMKRYSFIEFMVLGYLTTNHSNAISVDQMDQWVSEGVIQYLGGADDVRSHIAEADCVVLPSYYREGVPRVLLEAAAIGRPIIATNTIGCKDVVDDGVNGFLCLPRNSDDLADKMDAMLKLPKEKRIAMGQQGRLKVENCFDENLVIKKYVNAINASLYCN